MSGKFIGAIYDLDLPHPKQSILLAMGDHADHQGENIFASIGLIAWKTGYSARQVQRIMHDCETDGLLVVTDKATQHKPATYKIVLSAGKRKQPFQARQDVTPKSKPGVTSNVTPKTTPEIPRGDISSIPEVTFSPSRGDIVVSPNTYEPLRKPNQESQSVSLRSTDCTPEPTMVDVFAKHGFKPGDEITQGDKVIGQLGQAQSAPSQEPQAPPPSSAAPPAPPQSAWNLINLETGEIVETFTNPIAAKDRCKGLNALGGAKFVTRIVKPTSSQTPDKKPKAPRARDPVFDAIALHTFRMAKVPPKGGGRVGAVASIVRACQPDGLTSDQIAADIAALYPWYKRKYPHLAAPSDGAAICKFLSEMREEQSGGTGRTILDGDDPERRAATGPDEYFRRRGDMSALRR